MADVTNMSDHESNQNDVVNTFHRSEDGNRISFWFDS